MPELPEVEVVRRGLAAHAVGHRIETVSILHPRAVRRQPGGADEFAALLARRTLTGTGRRGKFLWLTTDDEDLVLTAHLGMSGQFRVDERGAPARSAGAAASAPCPQPHPHARVGLELDDRTLWFLDQRTFGWVAARPLVADPLGIAVPDLVRAIALDPTDPRFDARAVVRRMRSRHVEVKRLLLDQTLVSGIGNIYADEALWRAAVHPTRHADRLPARTLLSVLTAAQAVMAESLTEGGTSFDSLYVNVNGESGYFARGLQAYGRAGLPCARCGGPIVRAPFMNRSSHFCPRCQRPPRGPH